MHFPHCEGKNPFDKEGSPERSNKRPCLRVQVPLKRSMSFELKTDSEGHAVFQFETTSDRTGQPNVVTIRDLGNAGFQLSDFDLGVELGRGEGGGVRIAFHRPSSRHFALKEVNIADQSTRHQLEKELENLQACKKLNYIVKLIDVCYNEGRVYEVMELMTWGSLDALIKAQWKDEQYSMSEEVLSIVFFSILCALEYLHGELQVIHADIKPSNCLLGRVGEVKLADFGICRSTRAAAAVAGFAGTMGYMSPERLDGGLLTPAADVWSLGVVAVEYARGRHPYLSTTSTTPPSAGGVIDLIQRVLEDPPPSPVAAAADGAAVAAGMSVGLAEAVDRCLAKDPRRRASAAGLLAATAMEEVARRGDADRLAGVREWLRRTPGPYDGLAGAGDELETARRPEEAHPAANAAASACEDEPAAAAAAVP